MIDLKCDANNNIVLKNGDFEIVSDAEEVEQSLKIRLQLFLGEWFLDEELGLDFLGKILKKHASTREADREIKRIILGTFGVTEILNYSSEIIKKNNKDTLIVSFSVSTIYSKNISINRFSL